MSPELKRRETLKSAPRYTLETDIRRIPGRRGVRIVSLGVLGKGKSRFMGKSQSKTVEALKPAALLGQGAPLPPSPVAI